LTASSHPKHLPKAERRSAVKKGILWSIVLCVLVGGGLYMRSCVNTMEARAELRHEVDKYYDSVSQRAAMIAFELAQPYLDAENKGRYGQRLDSLGRPGVTFGFHIPSDSYSSLMWDLATNEIEHWAARELHLKGQQNPNDQEARWALLRETPHEQITDLHQTAQSVGLISLTLISDDSEPKTMEVRAKFAEAKRKMDELLARYSNG